MPHRIRHRVPTKIFLFKMQPTVFCLSILILCYCEMKRYDPLASSCEDYLWCTDDSMRSHLVWSDKHLDWKTRKLGNELTIHHDLSSFRNYALVYPKTKLPKLTMSEFSNFPKLSNFLFIFKFVSHLFIFVILLPAPS